MKIHMKIHMNSYENIKRGISIDRIFIGFENAFIIYYEFIKLYIYFIHNSLNVYVYTCV